MSINLMCMTILCVSCVDYQLIIMPKSKCSMIIHKAMYCWSYLYQQDYYGLTIPFLFPVFLHKITTIGNKVDHGNNDTVSSFIVDFDM